MVGIVAPTIWSLVVLASMTFVQCSEPWIVQATSETTESGGESVVRDTRAADFYQYLPFGGSPSELLDMSDGFVAGERTPVWVARFQGPLDPIIYERLDDDVILRAKKFFQNTHNRNRRETFNQYVNLTRTKRAPTDAKILYPSVLAVLNYKDYYSTSGPEYEEWISEGILYTLAFWNAVDLQLRYITYPSVRIRLAGIVLSTSKDATPYIKAHTKGWYLDSEEAVTSMMQYWKRLAINNRDFNTDAYDTVATMTSARRTGTIDDPFYSEPAAADSRSPCAGKNKGINGIIVHDDLSYGGVQAAVHGMALTLGATRDKCRLLKGDVMETAKGREYAGYGRKWSSCTLNEIANNLLDHGSCMERPKEYHKPGRPLAILLPGMLDSVKDLCRVSLGGEAPYDCFKHMKDDPCGELICAEDTFSSQCRSMYQLVPDGSACDVGFDRHSRRLCLDGRCVIRPTGY